MLIPITMLTLASCYKTSAEVKQKRGMHTPQSTMHPSHQRFAYPQTICLLPNPQNSRGLNPVSSDKPTCQSDIK